MDKIIASPKYGWNMNRVCKILSIVFISLTVLCLIAILAGMFATGDYQDLTKGEIISLAIALLIIVFANILVLVFYIRQLIFEKKLKLWKQDFVKLYARVLGGFTEDEIVGGVTVSTVLKFRYEGQEHVIKSKPLYSRFGESKGLQQIGQRVPIYYSPTYDEIVFIKECSQ